MSRIKKSRKAGNSDPKSNGQRQETPAQAREGRERKRKAKLKGQKAGSRNALEAKKTKNGSDKNNEMDKRIGSKKTIALTIDKQPQEQQQTKVNPQPKVKIVKNQPKIKLSPEKELAEIENNPRLNELLDQLDSGETISSNDQSWIDKQMARHQELMHTLGWLDDEGEEDLLQQFEDAGSVLDEFKE